MHKQEDSTPLYLIHRNILLAIAPQCLYVAFKMCSEEYKATPTCEDITLRATYLAESYADKILQRIVKI